MDPDAIEASVTALSLVSMDLQRRLPLLRWSVWRIAVGNRNFTTTGQVGGPILTTFTFDPKMPAYDIGNVRFGVRGDDWEAALYVNNVTDESARLALDQERGRVARVGYLTNQPRTVGVSFRKSFGAPGK